MCCLFQCINICLASWDGELTCTRHVICSLSFVLLLMHMGLRCFQRKKIRCETECLIFQKKREARGAALRNFILKHALSLEEQTVVMMDPWKICYDNTTRKTPSSADSASLRKQKLLQKFQMGLTHLRNAREKPLCT